MSDENEVGATSGDLGGALVSGLFNLGGGFLNNVFGKKSSKKEFERNLALWNLQNEYNLPKNQMARLKDAGLNPNLVYGNGATTLAAQTHSANEKYVSPYQLDAFNVLNAYQDLRQKDAQTQNINAQTLMLKKDLEFYKKHGFKPGTNDYLTKLLGIVEKVFGVEPDGNGGYSFVNSGTNVRKKGKGDPNKHVIVHDDTKPAVGRNVISVPDSGVKFFPRW